MPRPDANCPRYIPHLSRRHSDTSYMEEHDACRTTGYDTTRRRQTHPADKRAIMHRATDDLRASVILNGVIKVGDPLPAFALKNAFGQEVRSVRACR